MPNIDEETFQQLLKDKLDNQWERGLLVFRNYGSNCATDVLNVLLHAVNKQKVPEVLRLLEEHYNSDLQFQHPEIRGTVHNSLGTNTTAVMFYKVYTEFLGLTPSS